ncbi:MAG: hypothetical protein IE887_02940 [Campylobacterales bacterium]|nr:hypothetical protein [Campylobacterales bacterium]
MLAKLKDFIKSVQQDNHLSLLDEARRICKELLSSELSHLNISDYTYTPTLAVEELGIEKELVEQLVEDYVEQVTKAVVQFERYLKNLQNSEQNETVLDYTLFRELAHKNLGVARNLRIKDAQVLLYELMKKDDLNYLMICLEALKYCAIKLKPKRAYDTIRLMQIKSSL